MEINSVLQNTEKNIRDNKIRSVEDVQRLPYNIVLFSEDMLKRNRALKDFLYKNMYRHYRVQRMSVKAERVLTQLFNNYMEEPTILPQHIQNRFETTSKERTICDYIAGMTDRYAIDEHQKLFDPTVLP
jgi:dGTPase